MFNVSIFKSLQKQIGEMKDLAKVKLKTKKSVVKRIDKIEEKIKSLRIEQAALVLEIESLRMEQAAMVLEIEMAEESAEALENILRSGKEVKNSVN